MHTLQGGWGRFKYKITGRRRRAMKRIMARRRRRSERRFVRAPDPDAAVAVETNRQTGQRWHWSRDAMW